MIDKMKAFQYLGSGKYSLNYVPKPEVEPGYVIVAPEAVGICGTDIHIIKGEYKSNPPLTLGHEIAGKIVEIGSGVSDLNVGDLVTIEPHKYCGACLYCQTGNEHMCIDKQAYGVHLDGGMAEFIKVPSKVAYKLPNDMLPSIGALTEPLACVVHSMDRMAPLSGFPILVIGCGPAGSLLISLSKLQGLTPIVAVDLNPERRKLAKDMGADYVHASIDDINQNLIQYTQGYGFSYLVDAVGNSKVLEDLMKYASRKATILVFGVASPIDSWKISPNEIYSKELTILGSAINPFTHKRALSLLNRLPYEKFKVGTFKLSEFDNAINSFGGTDFHKIQFNPQL